MPILMSIPTCIDCTQQNSRTVDQIASAIRKIESDAVMICQQQGIGKKLVMEGIGAMVQHLLTSHNVFFSLFFLS